MRRALLTITAVAALAALAPPAGATVTGTYEGNYFRGTSHVFYFLVSNNVGAADLRVCFWKYNGSTFTRLNSVPCTASGVASGNYTYMTYTVNDVGSFNGATYEVCASQYYGGTEGGISCGHTAGSNIAPRVDNTSPTITLGVGGAADYTNNPQFPISINYTDATSPPFNKGFAESGETILKSCVQQGASAANVCLSDGNFAQAGTCANAVSYPNVNDRRVANYSCNTTVPNDGKWWVCIRMTDDAWDGTHTGSVAQGYRATGGDAGHEGNRTETCSYLTLDRVGPVIGTTTGTPGTAAPGQNVAFATSATDATSGVASYSWNFGDGTANGSGVSVNHAYATAGSKTATLTVTDNAGNSSTKTVTTSVVAPDTSAPDTSITDGPSGSTTATSAAFSFTATEAATFECKLDAGSYAACSSPRSYSGLALGSHTFSVRAKDGAGNTDPSPAARAWTVAAPATDPPAGGTGGGGGDTGAGGTDTGGGATTTGGGETGGGATSPPPSVAGTGDEAPAGGSAEGATQVVQQIGKTGTRSLTFGGLTVTVPRTVSLAKLKRRLPMLLKARRPGKVVLRLRRGARSFEDGALRFVKPGRAGFRLGLGKTVAPGAFSLDVSFTPVGSTRTLTKTFAVKLVR
ncbi:MAG: PKD domain-containing protein [Solirubrobacteraceae bacterium]